MNNLEENLKSVKSVHKIQGEYGNWSLDEYMLGLYNGLELALSIMENREPDFREKPEK